MIKILIIDDEENFAFFIARNLEACGNFEVTTCSDAPKSLDVALQQKPDAILLDILMPKMSGHEVVVQLKKNDQTKNIPVIFITATITKDQIDKSHVLINGNRVLAKPVSTEDLTRVIKESLNVKN